MYSSQSLTAAASAALRCLLADCGALPLPAQHRLYTSSRRLPALMGSSSCSQSAKKAAYCAVWLESFRAGRQASWLCMCLCV
jgi:hypothetical protein